ncbi:SRPBCC family protein [Steroidobacter sp.]|uniref:SRPBCC family protein n=1 Tax=Steroidobacter sp. TaxID=1978227 RepID=UPI001A3FD7E2|nr:SRPBCC family protein [Steroidobacter sp.]MBL8269197.1 SRPBCC family protein [Steroidobacter sp.]
MNVHVSSVIDAPIEVVWAAVRDFNALPQWHPNILASRIEDARAVDAVGCIRNFQLQDGSSVREQLLTLSDREYRFCYSMLESELGLYDYISEFSLQRVTDGNRTFAVWSAQFRTEPGREQEKATMVGQGVFQVGFDALKKKLNR